MIERFEAMIRLLGTVDWNAVSAIATCAGVLGIFFAYSQLKETKRNKQVELCTYFYDKFENMNKDETIVEFREYLDDLSFIDKCKDECVYEGKDEIVIPKEVLEKISVDYEETLMTLRDPHEHENDGKFSYQKFRENAPVDKLCNFFEILGILTKEKYIPIELIDQFFGNSIVFHWIGLHPWILYNRKPHPAYIERTYLIEHRRNVCPKFEYLFNEIIKRMRLQIS